MRKITSFLLLMLAVVAVNAETVYFKNTKSWTNVYAYCWDGEAGKVLGEWPGSEMTAVDGQDGWFSVDFTAMPGKIIFNNNAGSQTGDLTLDATKGYYYNEGWTTSFTGTVEVISNTIYYNNSSSAWEKVYAYTFNGAVGGLLGGWPGTEMTAVADHAGWFSIAIPAEGGGVIIFNCGSDKGKTPDLTLDAANVYYNGSAWQSSFEGGGGTVVEPSNGDYYLVGYINGADCGIEADHENLGSYHFVEGKLTAAFTADSYVMVKTSDNANWYMAEAYMELEEGATATFKNTQLGAKEKVKVPGGVTLHFVLTEQEDGSLTLSYTKGGSTVLETVENIAYTLQDGVLSLELQSEQTIRLFSVSGNMIDSAVTATYTRQLAQGVYFLRIGKQTQKIVVF